MAREFIYDYRKPGFPQNQNSEKSYRTIIEYIGPYDELQLYEPATGSTWGDFAGYVTGSTLTPIEGSQIGELRIDIDLEYDASASTEPGTPSTVTWEVEWVSFERSMYEHPKFRLGGGGTYALENDDIIALERWNNEESEDKKKAFQYMGDTSPQDLTTNAKMFAQGILLGQETYEDFSPVVRKTTTYVNGNPGSSTAGQKEDPSSFQGKPTGYEWRKSADRAIQSGGRNRWDRVEEWMGAIKVLTDRDEVFWDAP